MSAVKQWKKRKGKREGPFNIVKKRSKIKLQDSDRRTIFFTVVTVAFYGNTAGKNLSN